MIKAPMIYAISGPAGAGKSHLLEGIAHIRPDIFQPFRPQYPRDRGPKLGAFSQSAYDYQAIAYATMYQENLYCDRFLIDRIVYRWIENGKVDEPEAWLGDMRASWVTLRTTAIREANHRLFMDVRMTPNCEINFLLPDVRTIQLQRNLTGKEYPFDAELEHRYFTLAYDWLSEYPIQGISVVKNGVYYVDHL